jgi:hypothetical protein
MTDRAREPRRRAATVMARCQATQPCMIRNGVEVTRIHLPCRLSEGHSGPHICTDLDGAERSFPRRPGEWLSLQAELDELEANDPAVAEASHRLDDVVQKIIKRAGGQP